jgi:hypothetical protein
VLRYHSAVRCVKLNERTIIRQRFAEAALKTGKRDFWAEVRRLTGNRGLPARVVDNRCSPQDIASLFDDKYSDLLSSILLCILFCY